MATTRFRLEGYPKIIPAILGVQASQWAGPAFKFLSPAHTRPKPWWARPDQNPTRPDKVRSAQTAQIIQEQGLSQFYLKMSIILTLAVE